MSQSRAFLRAQQRRRDAEQRREVRLRRAALGALVVAGAAAPSASAATFPVSNLADAGAGSLRQAILDANAAPGADEVTFAAGLTGQISLASQIPVADALTITGPSAGGIVLDGGGTTRLLDATAALTVSDLTLRNGDAGGGSGGAIAVSGSPLRLTDVTVTGSTASRGGGVYVSGNSVEISGTTMTGNTATYSGGALTTDGNSSVVASDRLTISDSVFSGNTSAANGGGVALYDNYVDTLVQRTTIDGNTVTGNGSSFEDGGGIWIEDTYNGRSTTVRDSTITGNTTPDAGGGIAFGENFYGPTEVVGSTITGNTAAVGGGVSMADDEPLAGLTAFAVRNSTITGNTATQTGGGLSIGYASGSSDGDTAVVGTVLAGNTASGGAPDLFRRPGHTGTITVGNSLLQDPTGATFTEAPAGTVITGVDPRLGALADNGGPTRTRLPLVGSPLRDAGVASGLTADQRGRTRTVDIPGVADAAGSDGTDIGAAELQVNAIPTIAGPASAAVDEDTPVTIAGLSVTDPDDTGAAGTATFAVDRGTVSLALAGATGNGTGTVTVSATRAALNAALAGGALTYAPAPDSTAGATLTVTYDDGVTDETGTRGTAVPRTVTLDVRAINDAPTLAVPGAQRTVAGGSFAFGTLGGNAIRVADVDATTVSVTLVTGGGTLRLPTADGLAFQEGAPSGATRLRFTGAVAAVNAALDGLAYTAPAGRSAPDRVDVTVDDQGGTGAGGVLSAAAAVPVTIAPTVTPAGSPVLCGEPVVLRPVLTGTRVQFTGVTLPAYAGRQVEVRSGSTVVARTTVAADGTFSRTIKAPPKRRQASVTYKAVVANTGSPTYRLVRRVTMTQEGTRLTGRLRLSRQIRRGTTGILYVDTSCGGRKRAAKITLARDGRFTATVSRPSQGFAVYRVRIRVSRTLVTWTAPLIVLPGSAR
ncbi:beta strand repeat-containing protein [Paraconexibacter algicola]|uniref:Right handed beta helix domain-containing protein n=1 Tax=Paraconexibacter algicola TaxID=2133960 RepID=A0A2T4ULI6_9ACTN|nr:right-handed parallel beta-helix repeat-containing protein [Paraconexibacter algicola]PTL60106.1 hypothetical protein C7Y72_10845 [Paraconexibacter algicola]